MSECSSATGLDALIPSGDLRDANNETSLKPSTDRARPTQRGKAFSVHSFIEQHPQNRNQRLTSVVKERTAIFKQRICGSQRTFQKDWKWEKREVIMVWVNGYHAPWRNQNSSKYYRDILEERKPCYPSRRIHQKHRPSWNDIKRPSVRMGSSSAGHLQNAGFPNKSTSFLTSWQIFPR